ncbi:MAG: hypothetical protein OZSIB_2358 [Candidatus Ozemobacter sibiricus]|jgi:hypothetical protein|uniref:Uncharacterized protein n=1 Tax=Candidatus Ozemobacter sibiricus TaxID=2268124 RepID=A0A367ZUG5_9BACT|nr:MAG: hypothetical protein OZSIB_2358 [Candidatus Ozemobacter sibiricus]
MQDQDTLEFTYGGGWMALFGLPFFLSGLSALAIPFVEFSKRQGPDGFVLLVPAFMSIPFLLIGVGLLFGRSALILDRRRQKVVQWWGLLVPFSKTERDFQELDRVELSVERRGGKNKVTVFPVTLTGKGKPIEIDAPRTHFAARTLAEKVAKFLQLGIMDSSMGVGVFREAGTLDESLRDRILRQDGPAPPPPADDHRRGRIHYQTRDETGAFILPRVGFTPAMALTLGIGGLVALVCAGVFLVPILSMLDEKDGDWPALVMISLFILPIFISIGGMLIYGIKTTTTQEKLLASPRGLVIERTDCFGKTQFTMPAAELEELERGVWREGPRAIFAEPALHARSDKTEIAFGHGLTPNELDWLWRAIRHHLTAESQV